MVWQAITDLIQNLAIIVLFVLLMMERRLRRHIPNIHITLEGKLKTDQDDRRPDL